MRMYTSNSEIARTHQSERTSNGRSRTLKLETPDQKPMQQLQTPALDDSRPRDANALVVNRVVGGVDHNHNLDDLADHDTTLHASTTTLGYSCLDMAHATPKKLVHWALNASLSDLGSPFSDAGSSESCNSTSSLQYINSQLVAHGFVHDSGLSLEGLAKADADRVVKCLLGMLSQRIVSCSLYRSAAYRAFPGRYVAHGRPHHQAENALL